MLTIDRSAPLPLYQQLYQQFREDILSGALPAGFRLPSIRALSRDLHLGRNSVENAYQQLVLEGYVRSVPGSGYLVSPLDLPLFQNPPLDASTPPKPSAVPDPAPPVRYSFQYGELGAEDFPAKQWRTLAADLLDEPWAKEVHRLSGSQGDFALRQSLGRYLYRSRGVHCQAEQIVLCGGTQAALEIILRLFPQAKAVAMEDPGYDGARAVFRSCGLDIHPVPVEPEGISLTDLAGQAAPLVYVSPSHQFPTGAVMPVQKRIALLRLASDKDWVLIEDDYDSEFRYKGQPIPSLQSIDTAQRVIYIGTFSKSLSAGLRMAYLVLPPRLLPVYQAAYQGYACSVPLLEQKVLARFMEEGLWEKQLRRVCHSHRRKHDLLLAALKAQLGAHIRIHGAHAGLHLLLEFPQGQREDTLVEQARAQGVEVCPASPFYLDRRHCPGTQLVLGYGKIKEEDIETAVARLAEAWFGTTPCEP